MHVKPGTVLPHHSPSVSVIITGQLMGHLAEGEGRRNHFLASGLGKLVIQKEESCQGELV